MPDVFSPEERSRIMARVRGVNTNPEKVVRSLVHRMGYRFRLHVKELPGKPDIALPRHKKVIFVHGCFWHQHKGCKQAERPTSNTDYWNKKLDRNIIRDGDNIEKLEYLGWKVLVIWECEIKKPDLLTERVLSFLSN